MKIKSAHTIESTMTGPETKAFSIAVNGKAFSILLDGLYTNKIRAVVRELWTNAFDSHVDAGIGGVPFDVHLPTRLDPTFRVRDYGVSLSHESVMGLYTTLFDSTKDDSNDMVGALGLGSKSPFAYTDSFTVLARMDGRKRTYLAAIAGDGTPQITLLGDVESDEAQGLEVSIAVDSDDFGSFENEARSLAIGFDPIPVVDGIEIEVAEPAYVADDASFAVFAPYAIHGGANVYIRQGCVIYPVTEYDLVAPAKKAIAYNHSVVLDVPIGAVSVAASREGLSLDNDTIESVKGAIQGFIEKIEAEIQAKVDAQPNTLAAQRYWFGGEADYKKVFSFSPKYRGKPISNYVEIKGGSDWDIPTVKVGNSKGTSELKHVYFHDLSKLLFVVKRTDAPAKREMTRYRDVVTQAGGNNSGVYLLTDPTPRLLANLTRLLDLRKDQIVTTESLPDPGPATRDAGSAKRVTGVYNISSHYSYKSVETLDASDDYRWIAIDRITHGVVQDAQRQHVLLKEGLGLPDKPLYLFTAGAIKRYKPAANKGLVAIMAAEVNKNKKVWTQRLMEHYLHNELSVGPAAVALGLDDKRSMGYAEVQAYEKLMGNDAIQDVRAAATAAAADTKDRYPMLFARYDEDVAKAYVAMCDAVEAAKE